MADYKAMYQAKLRTAEQVAEQMESGWVIGSDSAVSEPVGLIEAFARRAAAGAVTDVKVHTMLDANPMPFYVDDSLFGKMTGISWFSSGGYEPVAETLFGRCRVDGFFLEYDSDRAGGFEPLRFIKDQQVVLGLVTSKTPELEKAGELLKYCSSTESQSTL